MLTRDRLLLFLWFLLFRFLRGSLCSPRPQPPPQLLLLSRPGSRLLSHPRGGPAAAVTGAGAGVAAGILGPQPGPRHGGLPGVQRVKRGWVWNQFFVLEEYMGMEPLYIGKVSWWLQALPSVHAHTHTHEHADTLIDMSTDLRTHTPHAHTQTHMST